MADSVNDLLDEGGASYIAALGAIGAFQRAALARATTWLEGARGRLGDAAGSPLKGAVTPCLEPNTRLRNFHEVPWDWAWIGASLELPGLGEVHAGVQWLDDGPWVYAGFSIPEKARFDIVAPRLRAANAALGDHGRSEVFSRSRVVNGLSQDLQALEGHLEVIATALERAGGLVGVLGQAPKRPKRKQKKGLP